MLYSLLAFFIGSLLEGGENEEGTEEEHSRSSGMTIFRIFSEGEQGVVESVFDGDNGDVSRSVCDSSYPPSVDELVILSAASMQSCVLYRCMFLFRRMEGIRMLCFW